MSTSKHTAPDRDSAGPAEVPPTPHLVMPVEAPGGSAVGLGLCIALHCIAASSVPNSFQSVHHKLAEVATLMAGTQAAAPWTWSHIGGACACPKSSPPWALLPQSHTSLSPLCPPAAPQADMHESSLSPMCLALSQPPKGKAGAEAHDTTPTSRVMVFIL